jgi:hypothetical protein
MQSLPPSGGAESQGRKRSEVRTSGITYKTSTHRIDAGVGKAWKGVDDGQANTCTITPRGHRTGVRKAGRENHLRPRDHLYYIYIYIISYCLCLAHDSNRAQMGIKRCKIRCDLRSFVLAVLSLSRADRGIPYILSMHYQDC